MIKKKFTHNRAYIFQNADHRICFAIPYKRDFTLIGTTDKDYTGDPINAEITEEENDYLCTQASEYFQQPVTDDDIVWSFAGVRSLYNDGASKAQETTRSYVLEVNGKADEPKLINIFGGKLTTYRRLAESVLRRIKKSIGGGQPKWTAQAPLPGGDFEIKDFEILISDAQEKYSFIPPEHISRMIHNYGTQIHTILKDVKTTDDLGQDFGHGLYETEVRYLIDNEWAVKVNDILWRRTKLGIRFTDKQTATLEQWMKEHIK